MDISKETVVASMPIKPSWPTPVGLVTGTFVGRVLADYLGCRYVMSINELNGFKDLSYDSEKFVRDVRQMGIRAEEIWVDKVHTDIVQNNIMKMIDQGLIKVLPKRILRCGCGRVFVEEKYASRYCKLIDVENDNFFCKVCGTECDSEETEQLIFCIPENISSIKVIPAFLLKEVECALQKLRGREQIISRDRETGCTVVIKGKKYNIDVDFAWAQLFSAFPEKKQFLVASNHQIYTAAMVGTIAHLISDKDITFILTPYMRKDSIFEEMDLLNGQFYKNALYLLSCLTWKKKECNWNREIWNKYKKYDTEELTRCYREILKQNDDINSLLFYGFQYAKVNNRLGRI